MKSEKSAIQFYKGIKEKRELSKYRLVNGLFIVKYINKEISVFVGYFHKSGSVFNKTQTNKIELLDNPEPQRFNKKKGLSTTSLGFWKPLNIKFKETPIENILK